MSLLPQLLSRADTIRAKIEGQRSLVTDLQQRSATAQVEKKNKTGALLFLQHLSKRMNENSETQAARLASLALQEVFPDLNLSLEVEHTENRGTPATILKLKDSEKGVIGEPCEAFGGGPASLLGVVLRVVTTVRQRGLARFLILDEPLIAVSGQYQERAAKLLRKLCEPPEKGGLGFDMLIVTHNPVFMTMAHKSYSAVSSEDGKSLKILEGQLTTEEEI